MFASEHIPYHQTRSFSPIVLDYLQESATLRPFYASSPTMEGLREALAQKEGQAIDRGILVEVLKDQYRGREEEAVAKNIDALLLPSTFSICTAHQPNLATGPLYFIYKILHAIRLADHLKKQWPGYHFVPVFYMGSEDADLAELNHFTVDGKRYEWQTDQKGAVGRMTIDARLVALLEELEQQLGVEPYGQEMAGLLKNAYRKGATIQQATFELVHALFGRYGLVVLIADDPRLKRKMIPVFEEDLFSHGPSSIVQASCQRLEGYYNVQAHPREINLFYLADGMRERIERKGDHFSVCHTDIVFSEAELRSELQGHPERFSPNVILRGLFQETILPNIAFIGGGGEVAYWLQLKDLFNHFAVPFPVLILRNSLLILDKKQQALCRKLGLNTSQLFLSELEILNNILEAEGRKPRLNGEVEEIRAIYDSLKTLASQSDATLARHVEALKVRTLNSLLALEKKMLRSERKKLEAVQRQVDKLKAQLFPRNGLQERAENVSGYYARWGSQFIDRLYEHSLPLDAQFTILIEEA